MNNKKYTNKKRNNKENKLTKHFLFSFYNRENKMICVILRDQQVKTCFIFLLSMFKSREEMPK